MRLPAYRTAVTRGFHASDRGVSYEWGGRGHVVDFQTHTRGHLQGYVEACTVELLLPCEQLKECVVLESLDGEMRLYGLVDAGPLTLDEALDQGIARVVEPEETDGT